jgi:hypothetical protein
MKYAAGMAMWTAIGSALVAFFWFAHLTTAEHERLLYEREAACWDRGGRWETTGWSGPWCDISSEQEGEGK